MQSVFQKQRIQKTNIFYLYFLVWFFMVGVLVFGVPKYNSFVFINHARAVFADISFTAMSYIGDCFGVIFICVFCLVKKEYKLLILVLLGYILVGIFNNLLKRHFNFPRPLACYGASVVKSARWLTIDRKYSFPSGHTAVAFCTGTILANYFYNHKRLAFLFFALACCTAYSRIYLGEHFLRDVWAGSCIGAVFGSVLSAPFFIKLLDKNSRLKNPSFKKI